MKISRRFVPLAAALGAALLAGCASFDQHVSMAPMQMDSPVSASASLYVGGRS